MQKRPPLGSAALALIALSILSVPSSSLSGAWVIEKGGLEAKVSLFIHSTDEEFILSPRFVGSTLYGPGEKLPYLLNGESISRAYLLGFRYGAGDRLEMGLRLSYYDLQYNDDGGERRNRGVGDTFAEAVLEILRVPLALSVRGGVKTPTGEFDINPELVPLGENQWDVEGALAAGISLYPLPVYGAGEVGYRYRFENDATKVKPGNELFFSVEAGVRPLSLVMVKGAFEGLFASERENREFGFVVRNPQGRKVLAFTPYVLFTPVEGFFLEGGARFLLSGRDYPAGVQYSLAAGVRVF